MRRIVMAILASALGTTLLVGFKAQGAPPAGTVADAPLDPAAAGSDVPAPGGASPVPGATGTAAPSTVGASRQAGGTTPGPGAPTTGTTAPGPVKTTAAPPASRTITGTAYAAKDFGNMQVRIVVTGKHIDSISTIQVSNRPGSTVSTLTPLALSAQAVPTKNVSGATYSSNAWKQSLQSAINQI